jgi:hypothetical protein
MRASDLLGATAYDANGQRLGRIADLIGGRGSDGMLRVHTVLVVPRRRGRLLGYERPGIQRPWLLDRIARRRYRRMREVAWIDVHLTSATGSPPVSS